MRRGKQIAHGRDGGEGDAPALALLVELLHRALATPLLEERLEGVEVGAACQAVLEHLELRPFGGAHEVPELLPLVLLDRADEDPPLATLDAAERLDRGSS